MLEKRKYTKRGYEYAQLTTRKCRQCGAFLMSTRYFDCEDCKEVLPEDEGDLTYFSSDEEE